MRRIARSMTLPVALVSLVTSARAVPSGTLQQNVLTFSGSADNTLIFRVSNELGPGQSATLVLDFARDGNGSVPAPAPFARPADVKFKFKHSGTHIPEFDFDGSVSNDHSEESPSHGVTFSVKRPNEGRYQVALIFPHGSSTFTHDWALEVSDMDASARGMAYLDQGMWSALTPTSPCGAANQPEILAEPERNPSGRVYETFTYVLSILLMAALVGIGLLLRRRTTPNRP
jgi:hypothetical protein